MRNVPARAVVHAPAYALALISFCALVPAPSQAGVILKTVERDLTTGKQDSTTTLTAQDGKLRIESLGADDKKPENAMIFKDDVLIAVDHAHKEYTVFDRETLKNMADGLNKAMKQVEDSMAGLPPEQRAMVEKMMGKNAPGAAKAKAPPPIEFKNTGKHESVGGYDCTLWQAEMNGQMRWQHCVVPFGKVEGSEEMLQVMKKMSALVEDITKAVKVDWLKNTLDAGWEGIRTIDGYPVLTRGFSNGKPSNETVLQSSQKVAVAAASFEPPAGYKQRKLDANLPTK